MVPSLDKRRQIGPPEQGSQLPRVVTTDEVAEFYWNGGDPNSSQSLTAFLWRRKRSITAVAICGLLAGAVLSLATKPVYRARTSLQLEGFNDHVFRDITPVSQLPNASPQDYLQNEVKVLESDTLARRVANQLGPIPGDKPDPPTGLLSSVRQPLSFLFPPPAAEPLNLDGRRVQKIKKALTVRTSLLSQVMEVFFDAPDPVLAARGANAAASEFINLNREARSQLVQDTTEWLNEQAAELKTKLETSNQELQDFAARSGLILAGKDNTPAQDRMRQLQDVLTRAEADRAAKQARYEAAAADQGEIMPEALASSPLLQYRTELQTMRRQLAELKTIYTPDNYRVTRLEAQIAETEAAVQKVREEVLDRIKNDYVAAVSLERMISTSVRRQSAIVVRETEGELRYKVLKNELDTTQRLYDSVLERTKEAGAVSSLRMTNIRVIDPAMPPQLPYSPNVPLNMAIGLGIGTVGGVALVLLGARSGKIKQPGELASLQVPELGVVPSASSELPIAVQNSLAPDRSRRQVDSSLLRESFRAVLTSILFNTELDHGGLNRRSVPRHSRSLVVTSVDMMEGKTTIVSHLGIASAQQKRDVLLIDADLRRPRLHQRFNLPNHAGLTDLLRAPEPFELLTNPSLEAFVQPTHMPHLWVLPSGPTEAGAADLLHSSHLGALLRYFKERFDLILIDAPPMSLYSDARVLGRTAGGVVVVVRANTKSREELRAAYQKLLQDQIRVVGTILNDWRIDRRQARGYARYYNHYQQQDSRPRGESGINSHSL